jgi:hypothetical protein
LRLEDILIAYFDLANNFTTYRLTAGITGGWGEISWETETCHSSETTSKKRAQSQPSGVLFIGLLSTIIQVVHIPLSNDA